MIQLIKRRGSMQQSYKPSIHLEEQKDKPLLAFTFDDGFLSDYELAYPLLTSNGIKGTTYTISRLVGRENRVTWDNLHEMKDSGMWDVQCHTHYHEPLTREGDRLYNNFKYVDDLFVANGFEKPKHHAFPFGDYNQTVINMAKQFRVSTRATQRANYDNLNNYDDFNFYEIRAISADIFTDEKLNFVKEQITRAVDEGRIIVLYVHITTPEYYGYDYVITLHYMTELINHIKAVGIETVTMSELIDRVVEHQEHN